MSVIDESVKKLIEEAYSLEREKDKLNERLKQINSRLQEVAALVQKEFLIDDNPELIMSGIGRVLITIEPHFNILSSNKIELIKRFKENENTAGMVKEDIPAPSLKAYLKEVLKETGELPHSDIISRYDQPVIKFRKERS
jgi:hypothetical protein